MAVLDFLILLIIIWPLQCRQNHLYSTRCSSDLAILSDPTYSDDRLIAFAQSHAFGFLDADSLKFVCKLSLYGSIILRPKFVGSAADTSHSKVCQLLNIINMILNSSDARVYSKYSIISHVSMEALPVPQPINGGSKSHSGMSKPPIDSRLMEFMKNFDRSKYV
uniref:PEROXIDASE_4 domain-containing protein n=1 Tax=Heterorhabditis bacteriophora TaxID=37862 RepID=A0A1I7X148_HETBA